MIKPRIATMIEPMMHERITVWPEWLNADDNENMRTEVHYRGGYWTYSQNYIFNVSMDVLRYRKFISTLEQHRSWKGDEWAIYDGSYDMSTDPINCVMEDQL